MTDIDPHIFTYESKGKYIAHSLTYDLVCVADCREEAERRVRVCLEAQLKYGEEHGRNPIFPAPIEYWNKYWAVEEEAAL